MLKRKNGSVFYPYHPIATFENDGEREFMNEMGESVLKGWLSPHYLPSDNPDVAEAFELGLKAYRHLLNQDNATWLDDPVEVEISNAQEFDEKITNSYLEFIHDGKESVRFLHEKRNVTVVNELGEPIPLEVLFEMPNSEILMLFWTLGGHEGELERLKNGGVFIQMFSIAVLEEIGNVLISLCLDGRGAVQNMRMAYECYSMIEKINSNNTILTQYKTLRGKSAIKAKLENDPKQHAKEQIYRAWKDWQNGKTTYGKRNSQANFSSSMQREWDILENTRSIENWCRQWKKGENIPLIEPEQ